MNEIINNYFLEFESLVDNIELEDYFNPTIQKNQILNINTCFDKILNLSSISLDYAVNAFEMIFIICNSISEKSHYEEKPFILNQIFNMMLSKNPVSQSDFLKNASIKIISSYAFENYKDRVIGGIKDLKKSTKLGLSEENLYLIFKSYVSNIYRFDVGGRIIDNLENELNELYKIDLKHFTEHFIFDKVDFYFKKIKKDSLWQKNIKISGKNLINYINEKLEESKLINDNKFYYSRLDFEIRLYTILVEIFYELEDYESMNYYFDKVVCELFRNKDLQKISNLKNILCRVYKIKKNHCLKDVKSFDFDKYLSEYFNSTFNKQYYWNEEIISKVDFSSYYSFEYTFAKELKVHIDKRFNEQNELILQMGSPFAGQTAEELVQKLNNNRNTDKKFENLLKKISKSIK